MLLITIAAYHFHFEALTVPEDFISLDICQFPFYVVPREQILKMERLLPHEDAKAQNLLLEITCGGDLSELYPYKLCGFRGPSGDSVERKEMVFISHRWLNPSLII